MTDQIDESRAEPDDFELRRRLDSHGAPPGDDRLVDHVLRSGGSVPPPPPARRAPAPPPPNRPADSPPTVSTRDDTAVEPPPNAQRPRFARSGGQARSGTSGQTESGTSATPSSNGGRTPTASGEQAQPEAPDAPRAAARAQRRAPDTPASSAKPARQPGSTRRRPRITGRTKSAEAGGEQTRSAAPSPRKRRALPADGAASPTPHPGQAAPAKQAKRRARVAGREQSSQAGGQDRPDSVGPARRGAPTAPQVEQTPPTKQAKRRPRLVGRARSAQSGERARSVPNAPAASSAVTDQRPPNAPPAPADQVAQAAPRAPTAPADATGQRAAAQPAPAASPARAAGVVDAPARPANRAPATEAEADATPEIELVRAGTDTAAGPDRDRPDLLQRAWHRAVRRPTEWAQRPWPTDRIIRLLVTVLTLGATTAVMLNVVHLNPLRPGADLVFDNTTPTGGDFGAHVWGPAFLRDHLLGAFRLNGWSMDWYAGLPTYRFYMVLPALLVLAFDAILPYGVALKLVSVLGLITLPAACWAFGRLANFRHPIPELMAFGGLAFALDESFSIYGGNLKSTMAGEFSFSIALSLAVLALGVLAAGLRTGRYRVWAAVLIAAACVSHGIVLIYVAVAAIVFCLVWLDRTRAVYAATVGATAVLLTLWWTGPFLLGHEFMTDMKYGALTDWWTMYFPLTTPLDFIVGALAVFGFVMSIVRRQLNGIALGIIGIVFAAGVYLAQWSLPVIGLLWNPRVLPFFYLVRYLLMVIGAFELLNLVWNAVRDRRALADATATESSVFAGVTAASIALVLGFMFQVLPGGGNEAQSDGSLRYTWGPITATETNTDAQGDGWARYNFQGYEGRNEQYTEYHRVVTTMESVGNDPALGCGRAMWENSPDNGLYGTTMALMLLPFWTDGCIGSMEGLFFEASGTTPYHFLTTAAMSKQSSNPVRELRYVNNDASVGVRHLQQLGVRYVMVRSPEAKAQAAIRPELTLVASAAPWDVYLVAGSDVVVPLATQPVVVNGRGGDPRERNLELGTSWFQQPDEWAAVPADDGPGAWQRIDVGVDLSRRIGEPGESGRQVDIVIPTEPIEPVELPAVTVSNVEIEQQSLSFDVDQVGVPVLVRVSYFPNWEVSGAAGPFRAGPNMMVVVPESTSVELSYGRSFTDYATILLTLVGIGLCVFWRRRGDVVHAAAMPSRFAPAGEIVATDAVDGPGAAAVDGGAVDGGAVADSQAAGVGGGARVAPREAPDGDVAPAPGPPDADAPDAVRIPSAVVEPARWQRILAPDPAEIIVRSADQEWPPRGPDVRLFQASESPPDEG